MPWVFLLSGSTITVERHYPDAIKRELVGPKTQSWVAYEDLPRFVPLAFVAAEDNLFFEHWGFDISAIKDSFEDNLEAGEIRRGGSTITQQLVKISLLSPERSYIRKVREAIGAALVEVLYSKEHILEWYLNLAEMGPGIYGIKAAAYHWFRKPAHSLTVSEAVHIAMVLPSPKKWSAGLRSRNLSDFGQKRFASVLTNMRLNGAISLKQWRTAMVTGNFGAPITVWPKVFSDAIRKLNAAAVAAEPTPEPAPSAEPVPNLEPPLDEVPGFPGGSEEDLPESEIQTPSDESPA